MRRMALAGGIVPLLVVASSCASGATGAGITVTDEPAGANCPNGGVRIDVGPDPNEDGIPDSITMTNYVCDGAGPGAASLTNVVSEPPGANCPNGGVRIEAGLDGNGSGALEAMEVTSRDYVCDGADGGGASGGSLTAVTDEPAGANCAGGGVRIDNGIDDDEDGTLDADEVTTTDYVCDGADGTVGTLTDVNVEPAGARCSGGGVRIDVGPDTDGDGILDAGEVTDTTYVCNGDSGGDFGASPIVSAFTETEVRSTGTTAVTTQQATITVPTAGTVLAIGGVEAFCSASSAPTCASTGAADGYFSISDSASASPSTGAYSYFFLAPDTSENITRNAVFPVAAGTHTFYGRAQSDNAGGSMGFWRRQLTLIFVPHD